MSSSERGASNPRQSGFSTRCVHAGGPAPIVGSALTTPVFQTSTFFNDPTGAGELLYTRYGNNPNHLLLAARIAALEGADDCVVAGSGMAAIAIAILSAAEAGDRIVAANALYGGTRALLEQVLPRFGLHTEFLDFSTDGWQHRLRPGVRCVLVEVPTNPLLRVADLPAIAAAAHAAGAQLLVDSTLATPINLRPLEHGADLVVHSATKYLGGHSDVTAGAIAGSSAVIAAVRQRAKVLGVAPDPHATWLVERGIKTLALRMERHNLNGSAVAEWCEAQPRIRRVHYPGLASHPDAPLAARLLDGCGGMLGIELDEGEAALRFLRGLRLAAVAPSLGGVETLVSEPRFTSHADLSREERDRAGIPDGFLRFSLGVEDPQDIIADIEAALEAL